MGPNVKTGTSVNAINHEPALGIFLENLFASVFIKHINIIQCKKCMIRHVASSSGTSKISLSLFGAICCYVRPWLQNRPVVETVNQT